MDYKKLDPLLISAIREIPNQEERVLQIIIETKIPIDKEEAAILDGLGAKAKEGMKIHTAIASVKDVEELSEIEWIRSISLQKRLKPLK